ncbi:MAG: calcineurin-like phosphoesterase C-terminal domain-containing protein [Alistipes sp.]|nr:calcineurin-like phosphoesterase C-terminal domain-containing protein [Alistipes sp.]
MKTKNLILTIIALLCVGALPAEAAKKSITGTVTCDGKGIAGVVVTDGINMTKTDAKGTYALPTKVSDPHCQFVHISIPSGYEVERIGNAPQFYKRVNPKAKKQSFDFKLTKVDQSVYTVLALADHHITDTYARRADHRSVARYKNEVVPFVKEHAATYKHPVYMVALGDMTQTSSRPGWKGREGGYSFKDYMRDTDVNLPIFNAIGNHDHNHAPKGEMFNDETVYLSRADFHREIGPEYYSFNIGREHYVVVDNAFVITKDSGPTTDPNATKGYWLRLCSYQHNWLAQDIAALDKSKIDRIVVVAHCGLFGYSGKKMQMDLEKMLDYFKGYEVLALIGHHHSDHTVFKKDWNGKPLYQFYHPSAAGIAWYNYNNREGSPAAITNYTFQDGKFTRTVTPYGTNTGLKYRVYDNRNHKWNYPITERTGSKQKRSDEVAEATSEDKPAVLVNFWGAYTCKFTESTGGKGKTTKRCFDLNFRDWYWDAFAKSEAGELPVGQRLYKAGWQRPNRSYHIWRYVPADPDATIKAVAKDAMGNIVAEVELHAK